VDTEAQRPGPAVSRHRQASIAEIAVGEVAQLEEPGTTPDSQRLGLGSLPFLAQLALALKGAPGNLKGVEPWRSTRQQPAPY
jgi:hypothetical protein